LRKLGKVGELDQEILDEWEFWRVARKNSNILIYENKISFPDLQKLNAVLSMDEDYRDAVDEVTKKDLK